MKGWIVVRLQRAIAAAASLTGKRFGLLVASSLVATSAIVAAGMTDGKDMGPLAGLIGRSLAADRAPAPVAPEPAPEPEALSEPEPSPEPSPAPEPAPISEPAPAPEPAPAEESKQEEAPPAPEVTTPEAGRIKHVFVISLASSGYEASFGATPQMPYLAQTLRPQGDLLTNFKLLDDASLPNSIATVAGQPPNAETKADCPTYAEFPPTSTANKQGVVSGSGCIYPVETLTLPDQLYTGQFKWRGYMESMVDESGKPDTCVHPEPAAAETPVVGGYSAKLNPFVYFHSLLDLGDCATNDVPIAELEKDLKKTETTANFSYISPDLCNAGFPGQCPAGTPEGAAAADAYLAQLVPKILASPAYRADGLLIVTFGAANPVPAAEPTLPPTPATDLKVGTLLVSRFITPGATDGAPYTPYSLLRSTEDLFGLPYLAKAGGNRVKSFAPALLGEDGGD